MLIILWAPFVIGESGMQCAFGKVSSCAEAARSLQLIDTLCIFYVQTGADVRCSSKRFQMPYWNELRAK